MVFVLNRTPSASTAGPLPPPPSYFAFERIDEFNQGPREICPLRGHKRQEALIIEVAFITAFLTCPAPRRFSEGAGLDKRFSSSGQALGCNTRCWPRTPAGTAGAATSFRLGRSSCSRRAPNFEGPTEVFQCLLPPRRKKKKMNFLTSEINEKVWGLCSLVRGVMTEHHRLKCAFPQLPRPDVPGPGVGGGCSPRPPPRPVAVWLLMPLHAVSCLPDVRPNFLLAKTSAR